VGSRNYDLRDAARSVLARGRPDRARAEPLGHVNAALVLRLYGHALPTEVSSAAERLEAWREAQRLLA
jgi:integrase